MDDAKNTIDWSLTSFIDIRDRIYRNDLISSTWSHIFLTSDLNLFASSIDHKWFFPTLYCWLNNEIIGRCKPEKYRIVFPPQWSNQFTSYSYRWYPEYFFDLFHSITNSMNLFCSSSCWSKFARKEKQKIKICRW